MTMDIVDKDTRSRMMRGIRGKNTAPEMALRLALHSRGMRYRLHGEVLPGKPDLVFRKYGALVYVHGCFWHRHPGCRLAYNPKTREDFWRMKFELNVLRDQATMNKALSAGWRVATVWECALRTNSHTEETAGVVVSWLRSSVSTLDIGAPRLAAVEYEVACSSGRPPDRPK